MKRPAPLVLVSGGNRGIGFEACRSLAAAGATVLLGARKLSDGERAARELAAAGSVAAVPLDVADAKSVAALRARVEKEFGALDVLINNAGVYADGGKNVLTVPEEAVERTLAANLLGAWRLCAAFGPGMAANRRGRIVNVS
ncbi:MAG TPA: SDR family NAD(P)-dependent oxidoreductase, partial [Elusimicrobiota bacterium]|nr:SDR family NAD(P)-dependent oxidoreductase [Elusimicrobiota bacterium]